MTEDFERKLQRLLRRTINEIAHSQEVKHIKQDIQNMAKDMKREFASYQGSPRRASERPLLNRPNSKPPYQYGPQQPGNTDANLPMAKKYKTVSVAGTLLSVFGGVGLATFGSFLLFSTCVAAVKSRFDLSVTVLIAIMSVLSAVSAGMLVAGISLLKRTSRLKRYLKTVGNSQFCPIDMLVRDIGKDKNFVLRDLQKMIRKKVLPGAHIDDQQTCLMLTDEVYEQYLYVQQQEQSRRKEEEERRRQEEEALKKEEEAFAGQPELAATLRQGRDMIEQIRQANDRLEGEVISNKMFRLEKVAGQIFDQVGEHPEKLPDIRRLMNYYLPTTLKLLKAYEEFENQPIQGDNIKTGKQQIEDTLDTINLAFENLLDQLFADDVLDVSSDISVLETMLKQEGLTGSEFEKKE